MRAAVHWHCVWPGTKRIPPARQPECAVCQRDCAGPARRFACTKGDSHARECIPTKHSAVYRWKDSLRSHPIRAWCSRSNGGRPNQFFAARRRNAGDRRAAGLATNDGGDGDGGGDEKVG